MSLIEPPWLAITARAIAIPIPVPPESLRVVKKASKILSRFGAECALDGSRQDRLDAAMLTASQRRLARAFPGD